MENNQREVKGSETYHIICNKNQLHFLKVAAPVIRTDPDLIFSCKSSDSDPV